jgi:hypothetical protein
MSLASLAVAGLIFFLGSRAIALALQWLHRQSHYQLAFDQIDLVREVPSWFRGGNREFLARVRRGSGQSERISQLAVRPDQLTLAFKLDPWVEEVVKVSYAPGRISVDLKFREPVGWVKLPKGAQLVDGEARILPAEDVELEPFGPLIRITGNELAAPSDPRAGVVWKSKSRTSGIDEADEKIVAAARLARFLRHEGTAALAKGSPSLQMIEIIVTDFGDRGLFILNAEGSEFCWGSAPGSERPREMSAAEKWQALLRWEEAAPQSRAAAEGDYWDFSPKGLTRKCPHRGAHLPKDGAPAARSKAATGRNREVSG